MALAEVDIALSALGRVERVIVKGHDMTDCIRSISFTAGVGEATVIKIEALARVTVKGSAAVEPSRKLLDTTTVVDEFRNYVPAGV